MYRTKKLINYYKIEDSIEFYNKYGFWIKGKIVNFKKDVFIYKAVIKCEEKKCNLHYICICSLYLRKC